MSHLKSSTNILLISVVLQFIVIEVRSQSTQQVRCIPGKTQFPNPNDRTSFYKCDAGGTPILFRCPAGTWFNPALEVCDWDNGGGNNIPGQDDQNNNQNDVDWWLQTSTTRRPTSRPTTGPNNPNTERPTDNGWCNPTGPIFIRNVDDCSSFFMCNEGRLLLTTCPQGQYYNPNRVRCESSIPSGCRVVNNNNDDVWNFRRSG